MENWMQLLPLFCTPETATNDDIVAGLRLWRNRQLASSDWTQLSDVNLINKQKWIEYRQALRDLTKQGPDPKTWILPEAP
jgi:hypothetical protein